MDNSNTFEKFSSIEIEDVINSISGIISSKLVFNGDNEVTEIHVLADKKRSPKQISRDVQSAITAKFGIMVDHKKISIAQTELDKDFLDSFRLKINSINYSTLGNTADVKVILQRGDELIEGISQGANTTTNSYRLLAVATLNCIHSMLNISNAFVIEDIERIVLAKKEVVTVAVSFLSPSQEEELLVGSAIIKKDIKESVVKATLDAINRIIIKITPII